MKRTSQESRVGKRAHLSPVVQFDAAQAAGNHARVIELGLILLEDPSTNHFKLHYCIGAAFQNQIKFDFTIHTSYEACMFKDESHNRYRAKEHLERALALAGHRSGRRVGVIHWRLATLQLYRWNREGFYSHVKEMKANNYFPDPFFFNWRMFQATARRIEDIDDKYITRMLEAADDEPAKYVALLPVYETFQTWSYPFKNTSVRSIPKFETKDDAYLYWAELRPFQKFCLIEKNPDFKTGLENFSHNRKLLLLNLTCFTESTITEILSFIYIL